MQVCVVRGCMVWLCFGGIVLIAVRWLGDSGGVFAISVVLP
jgi:hypothetical protein